MVELQLMTTGIKIGGQSIKNEIYADYNTSLIKHFKKDFRELILEIKMGCTNPINVKYYILNTKKIKARSTLMLSELN